MSLQESTLFDLLPSAPYVPTEFEVTTLKALGGETFTRKFNI